MRLFSAPGSARGGEAAGGAAALVLLPQVGDAVEVAVAAEFAERAHDADGALHVVANVGDGDSLEGDGELIFESRGCVATTEPPESPPPPTALSNRFLPEPCGLLGSFAVFCFDSLALSIKLCGSSSGRSERW